MRHPSVCLAVSGSFLAFLLALPALASDWNQWRGPVRDGAHIFVDVPGTWPQELKSLWSVEVGEGHSGPVVSGDRVFLLSREGEREVVRAIDLASGKTVWSHGYPAPYTPSPYANAHGKGPKSTPIVANGKLITVGIGSIVTCWDAASGKQLWQTDFGKDFKKPSSLFYGMAVSPMIADGHVITWVGNSGDGAFVSLDLQTGKSVWKWTAQGAGYASPFEATWQNQRQIICQARESCFAVDPASGKLLWSQPLKTDYDQDIVTPLVVDGRLIISGLGQGTSAYKPHRNADGAWKLEKLWENPAISMYMNSPVANKKRIYGLANHSKGQFFCLDSATGKTLWTSPGRMGDNAAIIVVSDVGRMLIKKENAAIMALVTGGELIVFKSDAQQYTQLARYKVSESPTWAHPALAGNNRILIKDRTKLTAWQW